MKKGMIFLVISIFVFGLTNFVFADLGGACNIMPIAGGCTGGEFIGDLYFSHISNAHVCYDASSNCYDYGVCCLDSDSLLFAPSPLQTTKIFSLAGLTNSHVGSVDDYSNNFLVGGTGGGDYCSIIDGPCVGDDICLFSMSDLNNAHAGQCGAYGVNVCCDPGTLPTLMLIIINIIGDDIIVMDDGENHQISVSVINEGAIPIQGASVNIFVYDSSGVLFNSETVLTNAQGIAVGSIINLSSGDIDDYIVNATATLGGYIADNDGLPSFNFSVIQTAGVECTANFGGICCSGGEVCEGGNSTGNAEDCSICCFSSCVDPGSEDSPSGPGVDTFLGWGECEDDGSGDNIGIRKVYSYNSTTGILIEELAPEECFLGEEEIPFINTIGFLMFLFILGIFYYSEIFKSKKNVKNNKRVK